MIHSESSISTTTASERRPKNREAADFIAEVFFDPPGMLLQLPSRRLDAAIEYFVRSGTARQTRSGILDGFKQLFLEAFAGFLINLVAEAQPAPAPAYLEPVLPDFAVPTTEPSAGAARYVPMQPTSPGRLRRRRHLLGLAVPTVLVLSAAVAFVVWGSGSGGPNLTEKPPGAGGPAASGSVAVSFGKTYVEVSGNRSGSRVFNDAHSLSKEMSAIPFMTKIEVSCRADIPSMSSVTWWYRLASAPYNNGWWTPAVTCLNGDDPAGPYEHDVDEAVPICL